MSDTYLWDRQPGESTQAYEAARLYFEQGADRSLDRVSKKLGKSQDLMGRWSSRWAWVPRAAAYDAMLRTKQQAARDRAQAAEAETWAARRATEAEAEWEMAQQLMERARLMLRFPLQEQIVTQDGKQVTIKPVRWSLRDIPAMVDTAAKLARLAAGMETSRNTLQGPNGEPLLDPQAVAAALLAQLTDAEAAQLEALAAKLGGSAPSP